MAHLYKRLTFLGIKLVTVSEGTISELHVGLSGTMGALYVKQLAEKTHRGLRGRVENGRSGGGNSYGYDVVRKPGTDGEFELGVRSINPQEAEVVRSILQAYVDGESPRSIAKALNRKGMAGPSGGTWGPSAINGNATRGTGILNNELYVGKLVWNRLKFMKNPETGRRQSRLNPREAWIIKDVPELRIVPQELWDAVKARQAQMARDTRPDCKKAEFWKHQRPRYLLSGLMKCGVCGANYTKYGASRFACAGARDRATCANGITVRGDDVENAILDGLKSRLMGPALFEEFARAPPPYGPPSFPFRTRVDALEALFHDAEEGGEAFETLRGLIDEVRIIPEDGEYRLELKGELAGILALSQGAKNSERAPAQRALQIKVNCRGPATNLICS